MPRKSKDKGSDYERRVCQMLSLWVSSGSREDIFWRSAMSGGRATVRAKTPSRGQFVAQSGDISAIHRKGEILLSRFVIECKFWLSIDAHLYFFGSFPAEFHNEWDKVFQIAKRENRLPLMIVKQNRKKDIFITTRLGYLTFISGVNKDLRQELELCAIVPRYDMYVGRLDDMLSLDWKKIKMWIKRQNEAKKGFKR